MKICKKCNKEYKDDYVYCPKCGKPYDEKMKPVRTPGDIESTTSKIVNGVLYGFGGLLILAYILSFTQNILFSIFAILFGLSLFKIFYTLIEDTFSQIDEKYIKIARIVLPVIILFTWMTFVTFKNEKINDNTSQSNVMKKENNIPTQNDTTKKEDIPKEDEKTEKEDNNEDKKEEVRETIYYIKYNELGEYGKYMEYEKEKTIFYYLPDGDYKVEPTKMNDNICFLWIDYRKGYKNGKYGTAYNNKEKLTFSSSASEGIVSLDSSVHIYNSNKCDYKFTLID